MYCIINKKCILNETNSHFLQEKKGQLNSRQQLTTGSNHGDTPTNKAFLTIGPALPLNGVRKNVKNIHNTLTSATLKRETNLFSGQITLQTNSDGAIQVLRTQKEKEKNQDRISLDRRGLTVLPVIQGEPKLRLLSLQHNLINNLESLKGQDFPFLVFLDIYDNQLERISCLDLLQNLRVLLLGKNRFAPSHFPFLQQFMHHIIFLRFRDLKLYFLDSRAISLIKQMQLRGEADHVLICFLLVTVSMHSNIKIKITVAYKPFKCLLCFE